ncbi:hypothetical protein ACFL2O_10805 [Thermodesulfobacteriota bacterium]
MKKKSLRRPARNEAPRFYKITYEGKNLFRISHDNILWVKGSTLGVELWTNEFYRLLFWNNQPPPGKPFGIVHPSNFANVIDHYLQLMVTGQDTAGTYWMLTGKGRPVRVQWQGRLIKEEGRLCSSLVGRIV